MFEHRFLGWPPSPSPTEEIELNKPVMWIRVLAKNQIQGVVHLTKGDFKNSINEYSNLDNCESLLFCLHTFGVRRPL